MGVDGLARRLRKRQAFESAEQEAFLNVVLTAEELSRPVAVLLRGAGLSEGSYNVLRILRGERDGTPADERGGMPVLEVRDRMVKPVPDVTRLVDRLCDQGLVTRVRGEEDRRVVRVCVTEAGLALLARLDEPVVALHREQLGHLTTDELGELNRLLVKARREG